MMELTVLGALITGAKYAAFVVGFWITLYLGCRLLLFIAGFISGFCEEFLRLNKQDG